MASEQQILVDDLQQIICGKSISDRALMLRRVTDLFVVASDKVSDQLGLFDDVMMRLIEGIDVSTSASCSRTLARLPNAPPRVIRRLALDDSVAVAGPILAHSERVDELTLVESAKTKSQPHLLAISQRKTLAEPVTDVLVERGGREVVLNVAANQGAAFSDFAYSRLVQRSSNDGELAACVWSRPEVPRQHLLQIFADASEAVRLELTKENPRKAEIFLHLVEQASRKIWNETRESSQSYALARERVLSLQSSGGVSETHLAEFAQSGKFDETTITLSIICDLPVDLIEHAIVDGRSSQIVVIARAFDLSWPTLKAVLLLRKDKTDTAHKHQMEKHFEAFKRLHADTAKKAIAFFRLRQRATTRRTL